MTKKKKLKVYLAGASAELARIEPLVAALRADPNIHITYDWVRDVQAERAKSEPLSRRDRFRLAHRDRTGVRDAEVFWFAMPAEGVKTEGGCWELGYAQAMADALAALQMGFNTVNGIGLIPHDERIISVSTPDGAYVRSTLFTELAIERYGLGSDADTLRWLKEEAARG